MTIEQERLTPTQESEALRERLVDQIIAIYNTGRPSHVPAARHVLANRAVRDAFDALAALRSPPIAGGEGDLALLDDGMRTAAKYALEIVRKYDPGRSGLVHNLGRLEAFLDQYPARMCSDCPPAGYPTDATRCTPCPRRHAQSAKPTTSGDVGKLCERLRTAARSSSCVQRSMAEAKSLRNSDGEHKDLYMWPAPEQTLEGQAAALLTQMEARTTSLESAVNKALDGLDSIAGDRTPEFFPETSYECAKRVAGNVRALLTGAST